MDQHPPEYWLERAAEVRTAAKQMTDQSGRETMEKIAVLYQELAAQVAARLRPPAP